MSAAARFCDACGVRVEADPADGADGALKVVSVVFADLVGSTALQAALDAESVRRVMSRFYETIRAVVDQHGGALQKFIGDAAVVVFGEPVVREDDALRAVRCAADMSGALESLNDELEHRWGVRLQMRTGVNTGELVVSDERIFVGDTMNTAARLEQAAGAGEVLIGEATWRLVRRHVQLEELAPLDLRGKAEPVRAWRLVPGTPAADDESTRAEAPLVGRTAELDRLQEALRDAVDARACRLVTVIGSPGVGKSRLAHEFALALADSATFLEGHCEPSGEGLTFLPVAEVLRDTASIGEADPPDVVREKLGALLERDADRDRVVRGAATVLGVGGPAAPEETFWGVRRVLEATARSGPVIVVLDDVHWGQPMFLDLIEHLVEWARDAPILLVALARPELREVREALATTGRRPVAVIELDPLEPGASRRLVDSLLGAADIPSALLDRVLETSEGNPLFLGELLRMLVDDGALTRAGDRWVAVGGADAVQVPPTIHALLTARIERLRADERSVVERAAVIGKQFSRGAVAQLVAPPVRAGIDGHLESLRRKEMVEPDGTYWIDEPVYRFHHVLIRDAAYHLLLKETRAELHERFADWLGRKAGELVGEHEEAIAYHLEQAHEYRRQLGPLDEHNLALGARAASLLASAGRRALARGDLAAAGNLLSRSLNRSDADDAGVLWDLGEALLSAGDTEPASDAIDRLAAVSPERAAVMRAQLGILTGSRSLGAVLADVIAATDLLARRGDGFGEAKGHHVTAQLQAQLGRVADVEASLDRALLAARKAEDRRRITAVLAAAPRAALRGPSPVVRASGRCLDVVRILSMRPGNRHVAAVALRCQAVLEAMRSRPEAAREILRLGRTTLEELGLTLELHELAVHAGIVELLAGDPLSAEQLLRPARDGFAALGVAVGAAEAAALLGRALIDQDRYEEAIAETTYAEQRAGDDLRTAITWLAVRAEALARQGDHDQALALARQAVLLAGPTDALADKADAGMALARVLVAAGSDDEARAAAAEARDLYAAKGHAVGVRRADELLATRATRRPDEAMPTPQREPDAGVGAFEDRAPARHMAEFARRWNAQDVEGALEFYADDWVMVDHRTLGWEEAHGRDAAAALLRSGFAGSPDLRFEIDEVLACDDRAIAVRVAHRGTVIESQGAGEVEYALGMVLAFEGDVVKSNDIYAPEDRDAMLARFAELTGAPRRSPTARPAERGVLPGGRVPEHLVAQHVERFNAHDVDGLAALVTDDFVTLDHRKVGIGSTRGRESYARALQTIFEPMSDMRLAIDEVLACDDGVIAVRTRYSGTGSQWSAGEYELLNAEVFCVSGGRFSRLEHYNPDDRQAIVGRYVELGGGVGRLGDRPRGGLGASPVERVVAESNRAFNAHDFKRHVDHHRADFVLVDHRNLGWGEVHGRDAFGDLVSSVLAVSDDVHLAFDDVLACDGERVIAVRGAWRSSGSRTAGPWEIPVGFVTVVEDGLIVSHDLYPHEDVDRMLGRYQELSAVGGDPPR